MGSFVNCSNSPTYLIDTHLMQHKHGRPDAPMAVILCTSTNSWHSTTFMLRSLCCHSVIKQRGPVAPRCRCSVKWFAQKCHQSSSNHAQSNHMQQAFCARLGIQRGGGGCRSFHVPCCAISYHIPQLHASTNKCVPGPRHPLEHQWQQLYGVAISVA